MSYMIPQLDCKAVQLSLEGWGQIPLQYKWPIQVIYNSSWFSLFVCNYIHIWQIILNGRDGDGLHLCDSWHGGYLLLEPTSWAAKQGKQQYIVEWSSISPSLSLPSYIHDFRYLFICKLVDEDYFSGSWSMSRVADVQCQFSMLHCKNVVVRAMSMTVDQQIAFRLRYIQCKRRWRASHGRIESMHHLLVACKAYWLSNLN